MSFENNEHEIKSAQKEVMINIAKTFTFCGWFVELWSLCLSFINSISLQADLKLNHGSSTAEDEILRNYITMGKHISTISKGEYFKTAINILIEQHKEIIASLQKMRDYGGCIPEKIKLTIVLSIMDFLVIEKEFGVEINENLKLVIFRDVTTTGVRIYTIALKDVTNGALLFHNPQHYPADVLGCINNAVICFIERFCSEDPYYKNKPEVSDEWEMKDILNQGSSSNSLIKKMLPHSL